MKDDTDSLLQECNSGIQMAVSSISDLLPGVKDQNLKQQLETWQKSHTTLGDESHTMLKTYSVEKKEPPVMAKGMSWLKTNFKLATEPNDRAVAELITDGCNMGTKTLSHAMNQYPSAAADVRSLTSQLISLEDEMTKGLRDYL